MNEIEKRVSELNELLTKYGHSPLVDCLNETKDAIEQFILA